MNVCSLSAETLSQRLSLSLTLCLSLLRFWFITILSIHWLSAEWNNYMFFNFARLVCIPLTTFFAMPLYLSQFIDLPLNASREMNSATIYRNFITWSTSHNGNKKLLHTNTPIYDRSSSIRVLSLCTRQIVCTMYAENIEPTRVLDFIFCLLLESNCYWKYIAIRNMILLRNIILSVWFECSINGYFTLLEHNYPGQLLAWAYNCLKIMERLHIFGQTHKSRCEHENCLKLMIKRSYEKYLQFMVKNHFKPFWSVLNKYKIIWKSFLM